MQAGIQNEKKFAEYLDGKTFDDLSDNFKLLILALYGNVEHDTKIECWQSKYYEKADIKIRINGVIKGLSLKTGFNCSVHQETKFSFIEFLELIGLSSTNINFFDKFLMGEVDGKRVKALIYINNNFKEFKALRDSLNDFYIKANLIIRFLFLGNGKFRYGTDALVYGTVDDFLWATKSEILKFLLIYPQKRNFNLNIGALNIKSYDRNLKNDLKKIKRQNTVQVKWPTIKEDLLCIEQLRNVFYNESKIFYQK